MINAYHRNLLTSLHGFVFGHSSQAFLFFSFSFSFSFRSCSRPSIHTKIAVTFPLLISGFRDYAEKSRAAFEDEGSVQGLIGFMAHVSAIVQAIEHLTAPDVKP